MEDLSSLFQSEFDRTPYPSEDMYFKQNPNVAGMAAEDDKVILNPYSKLSPQELGAVRQNELSRIYMRKFNPPKYNITPEQGAYLDTTAYRGASPVDRASTIAARIFSGDPSAQTPTVEQDAYVQTLRRRMQELGMIK